MDFPRAWSYSGVMWRLLGIGSVPVPPSPQPSSVTLVVDRASVSSCYIVALRAHLSIVSWLPAKYLQVARWLVANSSLVLLPVGPLWHGDVTPQRLEPVTTRFDCKEKKLDTLRLSPVWSAGGEDRICGMGQMVVAALSVAALLLLAFQHSAEALAPLEPKTGDGAWFGVSIDFSTTTVSQYTSTCVSELHSSCHVANPKSCLCLKNLHQAYENVCCLTKPLCYSSTVQPVVYNVFVSIPLNATTSSYLDQVLPEIAAANAVVLLTVEPDQGLAAVTGTAISGLATYILEYQQVMDGPSSSPL